MLVQARRARAGAASGRRDDQRRDALPPFIGRTRFACRTLKQPVAARRRKIRASPVQIICTLGPASMDQKVLRQLDAVGVDLFRINMSHTSLDDLTGMIRGIRGVSKTSLCLDTQGAQVRTGSFTEGSVEFATGDVVRLVPENVLGDRTVMPIHPPEFFEAIEPGALLSVDFNAVLLMVTDKTRGSVLGRVLSGGRVASNKGVSVDREIELPPMTRKDLAAIEIARREGISVFAFSFASDAPSVQALRKAVGSGATVISKIESRRAVLHADEIMRASDAVLIDRGDLSREVAIEHLPFLQRDLIRRARSNSVPVYVATNLLESMTTSPHPTRAEINDIASTLIDGADGLVLAGETAIGRYPVQCARMVRRVINEFRSETWRRLESATAWIGNGMLENRVIPHGGQLIDRVASQDLQGEDLARLPRLTIEASSSRDLQQIALGVYSPLKGFMDRRQIETVLGDLVLPDGTVWTQPIVLPAHATDVRFAVGDRVLLQCRCCGNDVGLLDVRDIFAIDVERLGRRWFGSTDVKHPGVAQLTGSGDRLIGGDILLLQRHVFAPLEYSLSPAQTRAIFAHNGWDKVVGFHTRNAPHRAHEYIQTEAMSRAGADGLFISPALGRKKPGDFTVEAILAGYEALMSFLPAGRSLLSGFFSDSWYGGPREAVFTALCRKNFGCSHFIVGRDHTGVGGFYGSDDARRLFEKLGDIGIEPIFFDQVGYEREAARYREVSTDKNGGEMLMISGTRVRESILSGIAPPEWMMRPEVSQALLRLEAAGSSVFEP